MRRGSWAAVCLELAVAGSPVVATAQTPSVTLVLEQASIALPSRSSTGRGEIAITLAGLAPAEVTLKASPLAQGDARGFVEFPGNGGHDTIRLDAPALHCSAGATCHVPFSVMDLWPAGVFTGTIEAWAPGGTKLGSAPISAIRLASTFRPIVTSEQMHDGHIVVDVDGNTPKIVLLSVQNPSGSPPHGFELLVCPQDGAAYCPQRGGQQTSTTASFEPAVFWLEPGAAQTVSVAVQPCPTRNSCTLSMLVRNEQNPDEAVTTLVSVNQWNASQWRQSWLFAAVVTGSVVSVLLNNLFPTTRAKQGVRDVIRRVEDRLRDSPNVGNGLHDLLHTEATRLKLVLQRIWFTNATKQTELQSAQQATGTLTLTVEAAHRLSLLRADAAASNLSIMVFTSVRNKLLEAEEALRIGDLDTATSRLNEAQARIVQARADAEQAELRRSLQGQIGKLMTERGVRPASAANRAPNVPPPPLEQPTGRNPYIFSLVKQLDADASGYDALSTQDLLDTERDFYVVDVWTEYMERKLDEFSGDPLSQDQQAEAWKTRKQEWEKFSEVLLRCLRCCPTADQTQILIDLVRHDTTPEDVVRALKRGAARIECDQQPNYLEPVDIAFVIMDPVLSNVQAVRRLLSYDWSFGDDTSPPPDVDSCRHYFRKPKMERSKKALFSTLPEPVYKALFSELPASAYTVSVSVAVPFTDTPRFGFNRQVTPKTLHAVDVSRMTGLVGFAITSAIAVVTAFGTKYATSVPNAVGWSDCLTAFLLGFGLDQLRDTVSPSAETAPTSPIVPTQPPGVVPGTHVARARA